MGFDENDFSGIQESPLPNNFEQSSPAQSQPSTRGIQDPNVTVANPNVNHNKAYKNKGVARQARTEQVNRGYANAGETIMGNEEIARQQDLQRRTMSQQQNGQVRQPNNQQRQNMQQQRPINNQQMQGQQMQGQQFNQQMNGQSMQGQQFNQQMQGQQFNQQMQGQQFNPQMQNGQQFNPQMQGQQPPKKKSSPIGKILIAVVAVAVIGVGGLAVYNKLGKSEALVAQETSYESSGRFVLDSLKNALNNYDATTIDSLVGTEDGDSYLAQEWAYVNRVKLRQEFIQKVCALVDFEYPTVQQLSTTGVGMTNADGSAIMIESYMNSGESMKVTIPDYDKIAQTMDEDKTYIEQMFKSAKYTDKDYAWNDEMANLMLQYICDKPSIPTKQVDLTVTIRLSTSGTPYVESDADLDDLLFGSEDFHYMCAKFSQICVGWTGYKDEHYTTQELQHNPEYDDWYAIFIQYYEADNGKFNKRTSKWEPWYLRDDENNYVYDENGEKVVNYYSVKDENGNDWIQPDETILVDVDNVRQVEDPWVDETGIMYNWIGQNYIQNEYTGTGSTVVRVGDGSIDYPAGIGTTIITKVLGTDGKYHDVKVALMGYWTDQDAIDYAEKFSTKNRGFTTSSVVQLICYEIYIENLEDEPFSFVSSEMTLADRNTNISSRTGTMYGFSETVYLAGHGDADKLDRTIINDWATSTELAQKYVCWGKDFGRTYSMVFFDCLAGTGEIPTYSAYEQFTGKSSLTE
jgi:hypothetical protein